MRILIAEDDTASRKFMQKFLSSYGECDVTINGIEAIEAFVMALELNNPYELVCLDVMMPMVDGVKVLKTIRELEENRDIEDSKKARVIMTTALANVEYVNSTFKNGFEAYVGKPINMTELEKAMKYVGVI
jgi:two-component system chemotaxis response regulator CheY